MTAYVIVCADGIVVDHADTQDRAKSSKAMMDAACECRGKHRIKTVTP